MGLVDREVLLPLGGTLALPSFSHVAALLRLMHLHRSSSPNSNRQIGNVSSAAALAASFLSNSSTQQGEDVVSRLGLPQEAFTPTERGYNFTIIIILCEFLMETNKASKPKTCPSSVHVAAH